MATNLVNRIGLHQCSAHYPQGCVLRSFIWKVIRPLKLNADRKVIALVPVSKGRDTGMPGTLVKRDKLQHFAITANKQVTADANPGEIRQNRGARIQRIEEQLLHLVATEDTGWQADTVHNNKRQIGLGPVVLVWAFQLRHTVKTVVDDVHFLAGCSNRRDHSIPIECAPMDTTRTGQGMMVIACIIGLALLTYFFSGVEQRQRNPNADPNSLVYGNQVEVALKQNRRGHYVVTGTINGREVDFLLDTGATEVVIPEATAQELGLPYGRRGRAMTANGAVTVYDTRIARLTIGDIELLDVNASINPSMQGAILLGMTALRQIEFTQQGKTLTLRQRSG